MPWVRPYVRSDGSPVRGYARWTPGARREMTIFAVVALAAAGSDDHNASVSSQAEQRSRPAVSYPIRFPSPKAAR